MLNKFSAVIKEFHININDSKTKLKVVSKSRQTATLNMKIVSNKIQVEKVCYLRTIITDDNGYNTEIIRKIALAK